MVKPPNENVLGRHLSSICGVQPYELRHGSRLDVSAQLGLPVDPMHKVIVFRRTNLFLGARTESLEIMFSSRVDAATDCTGALAKRIVQRWGKKE